MMQLSRLSKHNLHSGKYNRATDFLLCYAEKTAALLCYIVRRQILEIKHIPIEDTVHILLKVTGWDSLPEGDNFMNERAHLWARFTEPQITNGIAYFLNEENTLARCQAAFDACWFDTGSSSPKIQSVELVVAELGKIDLLVIGVCDDETRVALCIEAKFGHSITEGQLAKYKGKIIDYHNIKNPEAMCLMIIAPKHRRDIAGSLQTGDWRFMEWKKWLIHYDNALPYSSDNEDFRRFRKTIYQRTIEEIN